MREALERYLSSRAYAPSSERQRRSILRRFVDAFDPATGTTEEFLDWWATTARLSPASRRSTLQAVSGFLGWLVDAGVRADNPSRLVRTPTVPRTPPKVLTDDQVQALRAEVAGHRCELAVELMLGCGLRIAEVSTCRRVDDWLEVTGKGKTAMVPLTDAALALWPDDGVAWRWSTSTLHNDVTAALAAAGIVGHTAHSLRRTCATRLMGRAPLHVVQAIMRHDPGSSATLRHYTAVSPDDMRAAVA